MGPGGSNSLLTGAPLHTPTPASPASPTPTPSGPPPPPSPPPPLFLAQASSFPSPEYVSGGHIRLLKMYGRVYCAHLNTRAHKLELYRFYTDTVMLQVTNISHFLFFSIVNV